MHVLWQDFKYQMINKFSSIDNACHRQKKLVDLSGEIYLITSSDGVWTKWKDVFEKHEAGDLVDPETGTSFNKSSNFKQMKPLVREFFRTLQGLNETEMERAAVYILHSTPTLKRSWTHPKIVFTKPRTFCPSCYTMKEWSDNRKKKTTIVHELSKLVPEMNLVANGEVNQGNWRAFKKEFKFTSASMAALMREAGDDFLKSKMVKGGKNRSLPEHTQRVFANFIKEKKIVRFEGEAHFGPVVVEPLKIIGWAGENGRAQVRIRAKDHISFALFDFRNIPGSTFEGTMVTPFFDPFLAKFTEYGCPRLKEPDVWLLIVEDRRAEQVYGLVTRKMQPEYAVSKCHYIAAPAEGAYSRLKDRKTKVVDTICLYFVYKAAFAVGGDNPILKMDKVFQVTEGLGNSKSLYDEAKYANYTGDELRMEFYLHVLRTLTRRGDTIFNVFGGSKPMYAGLVSFSPQLESSLLWLVCPQWFRAAFLVCSRRVCSFGRTPETWYSLGIQFILTSAVICFCRCWG